MFFIYIIYIYIIYILFIIILEIKAFPKIKILIYEFWEELPQQELFVGRVS